MIKYTENLVAGFSFNKKNTNNPVYVRGKIVKLTSITQSLTERFNNIVLHNINSEILKSTLLYSTFLNATSLAVLLASNFKFEGIFKLQLTSQNGFLKAILIDCRSNGNVRGLINLNEEHLKNNNLQSNNLTFKELVGDGFMIFHLDSLTFKEPYQAVAALEGQNLEDVANNWFKISEQIETFVKFFVNPKTQEAGAIFLQVIAQEQRDTKSKEEVLEDFNTLKILTQTMTNEEFFATDTSDVLYKLYNEFDIIMYAPKQFYYKCSCSKEKVQEMLSAFAKPEEGEDNTKPKEIECSFCGSKYFL